jgi:hypothetical protein
MKHFTQLVIYAAIILSGFFAQHRAIPDTAIANRELCFLVCTTTQPLAAIENSGTVNLIPKPNDQGNHQKKVLNYTTGKPASKHFYGSQMKDIICFLSGKSVNLFWIGNTSPSLLKVFRC